MKILVISLAFFITQSKSLAQMDELKTKILDKTHMQEDFSFLRTILEKTHPALYRYNTKESMQRKLDSTAALLNRDMPFYDYYLILAALIADIRCAHTYIIPKQDLASYVGKEIRVLPFEIIPIGEKMYITASGMRDTLIHSGDELLEIENKPVGEIRNQIFRHLWSDGYIQTSKLALTYGNLFGLYYYMMVERPDSFLLKIRKTDSTVTSLKIPALPTNEYVPNFFKNPVNKEIISKYKEKNKKEQKKGWRLEMLDEPSTALLRINAFGGGKNEDEAAEKMRQFMDRSMATLKKKNIKHLVVDLRNNGGGWDIQGAELFTYFMKDTVPVYYYRRKHSIVDSSSEYLKYSDLSEDDKRNVNNELIPEPDGTFTMKADHTPDLRIQSAKANRFVGNVYFLVNGGSGSTTSEFTAVAYSNKLGIFIGDETGGAYEGDNGGSFLHFQLPNSKISVGTPLLYYDNAVTKPQHVGRGVIPDYYVPLTREDLLAGKDTQLEFTLELIRKNK